MVHTTVGDDFVVYTTVRDHFVVYTTVGDDFVEYATMEHDFVVCTSVGHNFVVYTTMPCGSVLDGTHDTQRKVFTFTVFRAFTGTAVHGYQSVHGYRRSRVPSFTGTGVHGYHFGTRERFSHLGSAIVNALVPVNGRTPPYLGPLGGSHALIRNREGKVARGLGFRMEPGSGPGSIYKNRERSPQSSWVVKFRD